MRQTTVILLVVLAGTLFAAWFFSSHEKVRDEEFVGFSGEARINEFYAAERLLNEVGIPSDSLNVLAPTEWLPAYEDTIVMRASEPIAIGVDREALDEWISTGGHLVLLPPRRSTFLTDSLLEHFGFGLQEIELAVDDADEGEPEPDTADEEDYDYTVDLDTTMHRIQTTGNDIASATLSDAEGIIVARRGWGYGMVTVIADPTYFSNHSIDYADHARLLLDIVAGYVSTVKVWFIYDERFPSLLQLIWSNAPYAVAAIAAVVLLLIWSRMPSFGPPLAPESRARRSIMEHVSAAGHFAWRNRSERDLVASSVEAVMHEAERRHPGISRLSPEEQSRRIARMADMPASAVFEAIAVDHEAGRREFTRLMRRLQLIRKRL